MQIPLLGAMTVDPDFGWLVSGPTPIPFLHGRKMRFVLDGYADDGNPAEVHDVIQRLLSAKPAILTDVERLVRQCCDDFLSLLDPADRPNIKVRRDADIWKHVRFGDEIHIRRRTSGDPEDGVYAAIDCACDWDREHGVEFVIRDGTTTTKVGPFDGHLTNSDALDDPALRGVVYKSFLP